MPTIFSNLSDIQMAIITIKTSTSSYYISYKNSIFHYLRFPQNSEEYKGGTFEFVAYNISLYESTKDRCYELVNEYMED